MEIYIQEVATLSVLRHLSPLARSRVAVFAAALSPLLQRATMQLSAHGLGGVRRVQPDEARPRNEPAG